ncbi:hypothetical protein [Legionella shakespearei]|uniref:At1g61320/AtMIF1 LRR domain-containing protein n=1 Tax=Legionella shakespearei DSM 23087 TaxID=1122169 RepID=A0A0W0YWQ2_9GAMM|nr:hypothetical protein [Legionella shakespearei]KTD61282.1 hypothetical protein Lsha_1255 [Legionella shakespearei DSM 23087]
MKDNAIKLEQQWEQFGLLYEHTKSAVVKTKDPEGVLNLQRFLDKKQDCFDLLNISTQKKKKSLVINAWMLLFRSENYDGSGAEWRLRERLEGLLKQGFELYVSTNNGLIKATSEDHLKILLDDFKPISNTKAEQLAYSHNLAEGTFKVFDSPLLHAYSGDYYCEKIDFPLFPSKYSEHEMQLLIESIGPDEKITLTMDLHNKVHFGKEWLQMAKRAHPLFNQLNRHFAGLCIHNVFPEPQVISGIIESAPNMEAIQVNNSSEWFSRKEKLHVSNLSSLKLRSLQLNGLALSPDFLIQAIKSNTIETMELGNCMLSDEEFRQVLHSVDTHDFLTLKNLSLKNIEMTSDSISLLLSKTEHLETLSIRGCKDLDKLVLTLKPDQLSHVKQLNLSNLPITAQQLQILLQACPNLENLSVYDCKNINTLPFSLKPNSLAHLKSMYLSESSITPKQFEILAQAAPGIKKIDLRKCHSFDDTTIDTLNLSKLEELQIESMSLTRQQFNSILANADSCHEIHLDGVRGLNKGNGNLAKSALPNLNKLRIHHTDLPFDGLINLLHAADNLESVDGWANTGLIQGTTPLPALSHSHLKTLKLNESNLDAAALTTLIHSCPQLNQLSIEECDNLTGDLHELRPHALAQLKELRVGSKSTHPDALNHLINASPHLQSLYVKNIDLTKAELKLKSNLNLKRLWIDKAKINSKNLNLLVNHASNVGELFLMDNEILNDQEPSLVPLNQLTRLCMSKNTQYINAALNNAPNLIELSMSFMRDWSDIRITVTPDSLPKLNKLDLGCTHISSEQLSALLNAAPNARSLKNSLNSALGKKELTLLPSALKEMKKIELGARDVTVQQAQAILEQAPKLKTLQLDIQSTLTSSELAYLQQQYPKVKIIKEDFSLDYLPSIILDGDITWTEKTDKHVRELFKGHVQNPGADKYILKTLHWEHGEFKPVTAKQTVKIKPESFATAEQLALAFEHSPGFADESIHYGQCSLKGFYRDKKYLLPALGQGDEVLAVNQSDKVEIHLDQQSGLYYVVPVKELKDNDVLHFIVKKNPANLAIPTPKQNYRSTIQQLRFNESGQLSKNEAYNKLMSLPVPERIAALAWFCCFSQVHGDKIGSKSTAELFNGLITKRTGLSQHRASLFTALATELGINALLVKNEASCFASVTYEGKSTNIDLGGHHYNLKTVPMSTTEPDKTVPQIFLQPSAEEQAAPQSYQVCMEQEPKSLVPYQAQNYGTARQVYELVLNHPEENVHYAQADLSQVPLRTWWQIPALTHKDELLALSLNAEDYELARDNDSGYYFLKLNSLPPQQILHYAVQSPEGLIINHEQGTANLFSANTKYIGQLRFHDDGQLIGQMRSKLEVLPPKDLIAAIVSYCNFSDARVLSTKNMTESEQLNHFIETRQGNANQRLKLAQALCEGFGISSKIVKSYTNNYLCVTQQGKRTFYNLGANLPPLKMKPIADLPLPKQADVGDEIMLDVNNPFQTWNSHPLTSTIAQNLLTEITSADSPARRLVSIKTKDAALINERASGNPAMHVTTSLAELSLTSLHIASGTWHSVPSPIARFLEQAAQNPQQPFHWIINWSDSGINDTPYNSIIDDLDRNLFGMPVPANVRIVVLSDEHTLKNKKEDFYSRFDAVSICPKLAETAVPLVASKAMIQPFDAVLSPNQEWQSDLFGQYRMENQHFYVTQGELAKAIEAGVQEFTIHNPPLHDPEFVLAYKQLVNHKRYYFNGEWHQLPNNFKVHLGDPVYNIPMLRQSELNAGEQLLLNTASLPNFFEKQVVLPDGSIALDKGFFARFPAINLIVTKTISDADWYKLTMEAAKYDCALSIQTVGEVTVPEVMKTWNCGKIALEKPASIDFVVSNDVDKTLEQLDRRCVITVKPETQITSLFYQFKAGDLHFDVTHTDLLKALEQGQDIVFKGQFSPRFLQQLHSLLMKPPYLLINGQKTIIHSKITVIAEHEAQLSGIPYRVEQHDTEQYYNALPKAAAKRLKDCYDKLAMKPAYSHFIGKPTDPAQAEAWVDDTVRQLELSQGLVKSGLEPTTVETVLQALQHRRFVFLLSDTGEGKSYFVTHTLKEHFLRQHKSFELYQGMKSLVDALQSDNPSAFLFIDEANLSDEDYALLDRIASGEPDVWIDGMNYPVKPGLRIIFAGNPPQYQGRNNPELFKRFPYYLQFSGQPLDKILAPLLAKFRMSHELLSHIKSYMEKAKEAGVVITPRNAQSILVRTLNYTRNPSLAELSELSLLRVAIAQELKSMLVDKKAIQDIVHELKYSEPAPGKKHRDKKPKMVPTYAMWKQIGHEEIQHLKQDLTAENHDFIWTPSRLKIAHKLDEFFNGLRLKQTQEVSQDAGINGLVLEGEPGVGKSRLLVSYLKARHIEYVVVNPSRPQEMRNKLILAAKKGCPVLVDEFNSNADEIALNELLSGTVFDANMQVTPGFCILGTQNPISFSKRQSFSKALGNRLMKIVVKEYDKGEYPEILVDKFHLKEQQANTLVEDYFEAKTVAKQKFFSPAPSPRNLFAEAGKQEGMKMETDCILY